MYYPNLHNVEWLGTAVRDKSLHQIAEEQECSYSAVYYAVSKYNIDIPYRKTRRASDSRWDSYRKTMKSKYPQGRYGELASNWKGGRTMTAQGHVYIHAPNHPNRTKQNKVMEHRLVMEKHLGRYLTKDEDIHHINGDKTDNRIENLKLLTRSQHTKLHQDAYKELVRLRSILDEHDIKY